jgi:hypothetical protein
MHKDPLRAALWCLGILMAFIAAAALVSWVNR